MREKQVLRKDIKKWSVRICRRLRKGDVIENTMEFGGKLRWSSDKTGVPCRAVDCGLCKGYLLHDKQANCTTTGRCALCPLYQYGKAPCYATDSPWAQFMDYPGLGTATKMRDTLVAVLKDIGGWK